MHEKMTDRDVADVLRGLERYDLPGWVQRDAARLRTHIAALTAERDTLADLAKRGGAVLEERDALRERVTALGARARATMAAIVGTVGGTVEGHPIGALNHLQRLRELVTAESRLAAIRQRAGALVRDAGRPDLLPETTNEHGERMVRVQWALVEALRDALAPDAPAPSEMDGMRGEMAETSANPESTVPEAFANIREAVDAVREDRYPRIVADARSALSLLERRMGAQEAALRAFLSDHGHTPDCGYSGYPNHRCSDECAGARAALTDAPPVFTLEAMEQAMEKAGVAPSVRSEVSAHLESPHRQLRQGAGGRSV